MFIDTGVVAVDVVRSLPGVAGFVDVGAVEEAFAYVQDLPPEDKQIIQTWIVFEAILQLAYYILVFTTVFLLGRRIIQAAIAGFREARSQAV